MFIAALFTIARTWKQQMRKKLLYIRTVEYYSAIKRDEIGSFVETWMDPESVI